jgi:cytochrome P450
MYRGLRKSVAHQIHLTKLSGQGDHKLLLIYRGRYGFWYGMGQGLYRTEPVFRESVHRFNELTGNVAPFIDYFENRYISAERRIEPNSAPMHAIMHLALTDLWFSKGIQPQGTLGASLGETTGCYANGVLSMADIVHLTFPKSITVDRSDNGAFAHTTLISIQGTPKDTLAVLADAPAPVSLFVETCRTSSIFSCQADKTPSVASFLESRGMDFSISSDPASVHTSAMLKFRDLIMQQCAGLSAGAPRFQIYSTNTGCRHPRGVSFDGAYFSWLAARPSYFYSALRQAISEGYDTLLCVGSGITNELGVREAAMEVGRKVEFLHTLREDEPEEITFNRTLEVLTKLNLVSKPVASSDRDAIVSIKTDQAQRAQLCTTHPDFIQNPYDLYEECRATGPVHYIERQNLYLVLDYDPVVLALKDHETFSSRLQAQTDPVLYGADPPKHGESRQAMAGQFSARGLMGIEAHVKESAELLWQDLAEKGSECDLISQFALPLAERSIGRLLGLSPDDIDRLSQACAGRYFDSTNDAVVEKFFSEHVASDSGTDSFWKRIMSGNSHMGLDEVVSLLKLIWAAGMAPTISLIGNTADLLLHHHAVRWELQGDKSLLPLLIEESLRFESPEKFVRRYVVRETRLGDEHIPAGAEVRLCLNAANRDSKRYQNPDVFALRRNPKDNLAFGAGAHYCLGGVLARQIAQTAMSTLFLGTQSPVATLPADAGHYIDSERFRCLESLIVRCD